jgi:hypothetical protein
MYNTRLAKLMWEDSKCTVTIPDNLVYCRCMIYIYEQSSVGREYVNICSKTIFLRINVYLRFDMVVYTLVQCIYCRGKK